MGTGGLHHLAAVRLRSRTATRCGPVWEFKTGRLVRTLTGHATDVTSVAISPDGRWLISPGGDIKVWELATGRPARTLYQ